MVDIVRNEASAIALQGTMTVIATGTETTETVIETEIATAEADGMTDVSILERDIVAVHEITMTIRDILPIMKMTVVGTTVVVAAMKNVADTEEAEGVEVAVVPQGKVEMAATGVDVVNQKRTVWAPRSEGHQLPKGPYPCLKEGERLLGGIFLHLGMNSTLLVKLNKQVRFSCIL